MIKKLSKYFADIFMGGRCCAGCGCWNAGDEQ